MITLAALAALALQEPPRVMPIYLVPRDYAVPLAGVRYHARALDDVRRWYGRVLTGRTFVAEPLVVQVSRHAFAELAADSFQAWWPRLQEEFAAYGWTWNRRADFKLLFLTHGAGAWAGSDSENGGIDSASQAGRVDKGDWGGLAVIGDSSVGGVLSGACPEVAQGKAGGTAWWCSGSTYRGTIAHELGHTWGLPHPDAFHAGFRCADSTAYSIMQCHWEWARERLLDYEIVHLESLRFFRFDTLPAYTLLAGAGDSLVWVDGRGGGTGYLWAVVLSRAGARAGYVVPRDAATLALDLGIERGSAAGASLEIDVDGRPRASFRAEPAHPPQRVVVPLAGARRLAFRVTGGDGRIVLENARIYRVR